jgi:hypothetical protein
VVAGWEGIDLVEMIALHPILEFAGLIAGILADFKHRDDDDLYLDWARLGIGDGGEGDDPKKAS